MEWLDFFNNNPHFYLLCVAIFSLFIGSFLNVVIYRLPRMMDRNWNEECRLYLGLKPHNDEEKLTLYLPFSHCPRCKNIIRPWHNIPIFSYLWLKGRCAYCSAHISLRYPFVEALTCIASMYVAWKFGISWQALAAMCFTWVLVPLIFIDLDFHMLPDELTLSLLWLGLFFSIYGLFATSHDAIIGAIAGYLIFWVTQWVFHLVTGKVGMGQGDFKFLAALGAFTGWQLLPLIILLSSISGVIFAITHMAIRRQLKSVPLPFGPYLAVAGWIALLWGNEIMHLYLDFVY